MELRQLWLGQGHGGGGAQRRVRKSGTKTFCARSGRHMIHRLVRTVCQPCHWIICIMPYEFNYVRSRFNLFRGWKPANVRPWTHLYVLHSAGNCIGITQFWLACVLCKIPSNTGHSGCAKGERADRLVTGGDERGLSKGLAKDECINLIPQTSSIPRFFGAHACHSNGPA